VVGVGFSGLLKQTRVSCVTSQRGNALRTTSAERMRLSGQRRRQGKRAIRLLVNDDEIDFLLARGYPLKRTEPRSIAEAGSAYLADSVLEGAWATDSV
jgi:hypothetical protein